MMDAVVLGAGPAGLAITSELARGGADVSCVAPRPYARWTPNFGVWLDDLGSMEMAACLRQVWRRPFVHLDGERIDLGRAYGRFDNDTLQDHLTNVMSRNGGSFRLGAALCVEHRDGSSRVHLRGGAHIDARVVIDATGPRSNFVDRPAQRPGFQSAYGEVVQVKGHDFAPGEMALMDYRGDDDLATFLYAMPLSEELLFVEETSLVSRQPLSHALLRDRLHRRMAWMGIEPVAIVDREECLIPMGVGVPPPQRVIAFGAAGAFTHPATGYQVARSLRLARPTALAILDGLRGGTSAEAAARAYDAMWPRSARRAWELYTFGMEVLSDYDMNEMRAFLSAFFATSEERWCGYMSGTATPAEIMSTMARVFAKADGGLRWSLLGAATRAESKPLWRAILPGAAQ